MTNCNTATLQDQIERILSNLDFIIDRIEKTERRLTQMESVFGKPEKPTEDQLKTNL